ncbi:MAG: hypothetical protein ACKOQ8_06670 [Micrococcales bacterium]
MRDFIDGKRSDFISEQFRVLQISPLFLGSNPRELFVDDGQSRFLLGTFTPRKVLQRHRYSVAATPAQITDFFGLEFEDYLALYNIKDQETTVLARLRW